MEIEPVNDNYKIRTIYAACRKFDEFWTFFPTLKAVQKAIEETENPEDYDICEYNQFFIYDETHLFKAIQIRYDNKLNFISMKYVNEETNQEYLIKNK